MRTMRSKYVWVPMLGAAFARAGWGFGQNAGEQPQQADSGLQKRVDTLEWENAYSTLPRRLRRLEGQVEELRVTTARLQDKVIQKSASPDPGVLQQRVATLEQENREDHRAIWDLYERIQQLELSLSQVRNELNRRLHSLSETNTTLRQQMKESREQEEDKKRLSAGYPLIRRVVIDKEGRKFIEYDR